MLISKINIEIKNEEKEEEDYLAEIANGVTSLRIGESHHIEEKWFDIVVKCFVVKKEFGQQT